MARGVVVGKKKQGRGGSRLNMARQVNVFNGPPFKFLQSCKEHQKFVNCVRSRRCPVLLPHHFADMCTQVRTV